MTVVLTGAEVLQAALVGVMRRWAAIKAGRVHAHGFTGDGWGVDIEGACAEFALAKGLDLFWHGYATDPRGLPGDVGQLQVRSTPRTDGCLIVHEGDPDTAWFVLVVGQVPIFRLAGAIRGADAKRPEWWQTFTGRPAFFVPQAALGPLDDLWQDAA